MLSDDDDESEIPDPFPFPKTYGTNVDVGLLSGRYIAYHNRLMLTSSYVF